MYILPIAIILGDVICVGMMVLYFMVAYCHFYGQKCFNVIALRPWWLFLSLNRCKEVQNGGTVQQCLYS